MSVSFGPYTPLRKAGNLVFISGQIGINPQTKKIISEIGEQTLQTISNIESLLKTENLGLKDVVKTTVFLVDMALYSKMNEAYESKFPAPRPARSAIGVKELPRVGGEIKILIEIEAVACLVNP